MVIKKNTVFCITVLLWTAACHPSSVQDIEACTFEDVASSGTDSFPAVRCALVSTRFASYDEFQTVVEIEYGEDIFNRICPPLGKEWVQVTHCSNGLKATGVLTSGVSETDFVNARDGNVWDKLWLLIRSPYTIRHRKEMEKIFILARRREDLFGPGDPAFYDLSEEVMSHVSIADVGRLDHEDLTSEKGYFNTVNHVLAQVFMTTLFSEDLAGFMANSHERRTMPLLISGNFTTEQINDLFNGPVDNYADIINNEWGQELGKTLKNKYAIQQETVWTPELMADFLNDTQGYFSWMFQIGFSPFRPEDDVVLMFTEKVNYIMNS
jgi:hypothetical protein